MDRVMSMSSSQINQHDRQFKSLLESTDLDESQPPFEGGRSGKKEVLEKKVAEVAESSLGKLQELTDHVVISVDEVVERAEKGIEQLNPHRLLQEVFAEAGAAHEVVSSVKGPLERGVLSPPPHLKEGDLEVLPSTLVDLTTLSARRLESTLSLISPESIKRSLMEWTGLKKSILKEVLSDQIGTKIKTAGQVREKALILEDRVSQMRVLYNHLEERYTELFKKINAGCLSSKSSFLGLSVADTVAWAAAMGLGVTSSLPSFAGEEYVNPTTLKVFCFLLFVASQFFSKGSTVTASKKIDHLETTQSALFNACKILQQKGVLLSSEVLSENVKALLDKDQDEKELISSWYSLKSQTLIEYKQYTQGLDPELFFEESEFEKDFESWRLNSFNAGLVASRGGKEKD